MWINSTQNLVKHFASYVCRSFSDKYSKEASFGIEKNYRKMFCIKWNRLPISRNVRVWKMCERERNVDSWYRKFNIEHRCSSFKVITWPIWRHDETDKILPRFQLTLDWWKIALVQKFRFIECVLRLGEWSGLKTEGGRGAVCVPDFAQPQQCLLFSDWHVFLPLSPFMASKWSPLLACKHFTA